ncbi:PilZ domain-containing protein [Desulfofustis limnaeus]|uniref:PilZ domain-containing protein n=1 Tax=Desulfofustis limnaeus TaxID=2740163 RepID=A0ABN6M428_9BACT|nr:PilZ domain-containing protein [Desulfofustis limnaeus]BDD87653.1 hypothetical protein DPPLL_20180 [Desulfofustis limnaeus]
MVSLELRILLAFLVAYFSAVFVIPKLASIARSIGLIDRPERRKVHRVPRPLVGGIGIVIAATFSAMLFVDWVGLRGLFLGLAVLLFIGFLDDFRQLDPRRKFIAQIVAAVLMMSFSKVYLVSFGDLLGCGEIVLPVCDALIWAVTIFCLVGVINAINLIDGLDGLAGGVAFVAFLTFGLHASFADAPTLMLLNLAFAGAILGFLRFNWSPSQVFMGDAGSLCLGFALGFMAIAMSQGEKPVFSPVVPLLVLAVPITDTVTVMSKRIVRGQSPFQPDRYHFHHILMRYGMGRETAVKAILGICMAMSALTLVVPFYRVPDWVLFGAYILYLVVYVVASLFIVSTMRLSFKYRRRFSNGNGTKLAKANLLVRLLLKSMDYAKILRKDARYDVRLPLRCRLLDRGNEWEGTVENISASGCMAEIPGLATLNNRMVLDVQVSLDNEVVVIPIAAEHIWLNAGGGSWYHGFRFVEMDQDKQPVFKKFLSRCRRHRNNR